MPPPIYPVKSDGPHPLHFRGITLSRLDKFDSGPYDNLLNILYEDRTDSKEFISFETWSSPGTTKTPFKEAIQQKFKEAKKGDLFGPSWTNHWFRVTINLPPSWSTSKTERIQLEWDSSSEAMIFDTEGTPQQGLTGGYGIDRHVDYILNPKGRKGTYKLYIEVSCNGMFGNGLDEPNNPPDNNRYFKLESADLVIPRLEAWRLLWDFRTLRDLAKLLPENSPLGNLSMEVANQIMNTFKVGDLDTIVSCRKLAEKIFGQDWEELGAGIYKGNPSDSSTWAIGNCHIDNPWLWRTSVTRQKTARSWSTQLDLIDRYSEYRFVASQAQQFAWLETDYPALFQKIHAKVKKGQFQPIGGCWVEMDCNLPSGEALCRQFLHGQRFFKSRFGEYCRTFWLPDSFGYSSQLPQLCRSAGMDFFFTQKLSWSQFNAPVHTSFKWTGQDGSQILTHMTPVNTYTAQASVDDVINSIKNHKSLQSGASNALLAFGNGDGGGGANSPMMESLRRCRAVAEKSGELPKVTSGQSVDLFFEDILKKSEGGKTLPNWNGELYLELHRGTLTSHGSIKKGNRKFEILLQEVEFIATVASVTSKHYNYPKDEMDPLWEGILLNQSHDTLPGSGIGLIYIDAEKIYAEVAEKGSALLEDALKAILPSSEPLEKGNWHSSGDELVAVNISSYPRRELVKIDLETARSRSNSAIQLSGDGGAWVLFENVNGDTFVGTQSMKEVEQMNIIPSRARAVGDSYVLSNAQLSIKISSQGRITSIFDLERERELISEGETAGFIIYQDQPLNWMAWDVDIFHLETKADINASSIKVTEDGPLRSSLEITYHFGQSVVKTIISLDALPMLVKPDALSMLRFETTIDWHERHRFLKFELPLQITSDFATYENQFGFVQRPTHRNTTWDRAKFEVVGHKFADLSEFGYGVAILNDYGYATSGSTMTLSLLRGPTVPDADQDQGEHTFSFAIQPHRGSFSASDIPIVARLFNSPQHIRRIPRKFSQSLTTLTTTGLQHPFILTGARNVILDTFKRGEDDHFGHGEEKEKKVMHEQVVILRLYEAYGGHGSVTIDTNWKLDSVKICDILERDLEDVKLVTCEDGRTSFKLSFRGFQVVTLKVLVSQRGGWKI